MLVPLCLILFSANVYGVVSADDSSKIVAVLNCVKEKVEKNEPNNKTIFRLFLYPESWGKYKNLQTEIARLIPAEEERPSVDLTIATDRNSNKQIIGIVGGVGPLSDGEILGKVMTRLLMHHKAKLPSLSIRLFSSPPPRGWSKVGQIIRYLSDLRSFMGSGYKRYYIASNTAHLHFNRIKSFVQVHSRVVNLVDVVSQKAAEKTENQPPCILILGTDVAYNKGLYTPYLEKYKLTNHTNKSGECKNCFYTLSSGKEAVELQKYIDLTKNGKIVQAGDKITEFIIRALNSIKKRGGVVNKILLGCTELSLALHSHPTFLSRIRQANQKKLVVIDTEDLFVSKIVEDIEAELSGIPNQISTNEIAYIP